MWVTNKTKMGTTTNWKMISYRENGAVSGCGHHVFNNVVTLNCNQSSLFDVHHVITVTRMTHEFI